MVGSDATPNFSKIGRNGQVLGSVRTWKLGFETRKRQSTLKGQT